MGPKQSLIRDESARGSVDNNTPPRGCFTLYEDSNYRGCKTTRCANQVQDNCEQGDNIGQCHQMPCADNCKVNGNCAGFADKTSSIKVGTGTIVTLYDDNYHGGKSVEYRTDDDYLNDRNDKPSSWKAKKDCDHNTWLWDSDCYEKKSFTVNNSDMDDKRNKYCNSQNINEHTECKNWCSKLNNQSKCIDSLKEYCNKSENITNSVCKDWCIKNSPECDQGAINYCKTHLDDTTFCGCFDDNMRTIVPDELETLLYGGNNSYGNNNRAICWSKTCGDGGYMTQSMKGLVNACPECYQVTANNKILIENADRSKILTNLIQSCNTSNNNPPNDNPSNNNQPPSNDTPSKKSLFQIENSNIKTFIQNLNLETKFPIEYDYFILNEEDLFILLCILLITLIFVIYNLFIKTKLQRKIFFRYKKL
jgi:hypothetical protein